jgi:hypothetical protein
MIFSIQSVLGKPERCLLAVDRLFINPLINDSLEKTDLSGNYESWQLGGLYIERGRSPTSQATIFRTDKAISEIGGVIFPKE